MGRNAANYEKEPAAHARLCKRPPARQEQAQSHAGAEQADFAKEREMTVRLFFDKKKLLPKKLA
ncbi:hypothetical protein [Hymenobacter glacialis]|uniref:hypothetical protein n=1 Tax=Hymenobacter glacialis TaxID=1908236 RepID=UPI000F7996FF|nr:hypothetical protein [Hymenobacter glacialis]